MAPLWKELGKVRPYEHLEEETAVALMRTCGMVDVQVNRLLRQHRLSNASYNILRILRGAGQDGRYCSEIAQHLVTEVPDMTRLLDRLEKMDLLERRRVDKDRRLVRIFITSHGLSLLKELDKPLLQLHQQQFAGLSKAKLKELNALLDEARVSLKEVSA